MEMLEASLNIHIRVDKVYTGRRSPMTGMNSIAFNAVKNLLLVIL